MSTEGVIHDIGYQRYTGVRFGRAAAWRALYGHGLRTAFGLGRSAKAKIFPWFAAGIAMLVAVIVTAVRAQQSEAVLGYQSYPDAVSMLIVLFTAIVAPELVSRDLRSGVLPLYFSRPTTRSDYALAKTAALVSAVWLMLAAPLTLMFLGGIFTVDGWDPAWTEIGHYAVGLAYAAICAVVYGIVGVLVASLAGRRAVAAALIAGLFLFTSAVAGVTLGIGIAAEQQTLQHTAGLLSPIMLLEGLRNWLWSPGPGDFARVAVGDLGWLYVLTAAAIVVVGLLLLLLRYRRAAR